MELTDIQRKLQASLTNGLVDQRINGRENLMPRFIYNDQGDTMWLHIERELSHCSAFTFVIAFITERALAMLKAKLADIAQEGVHGRIITADYLDFNNPKVFRELKKLPNVEVRIAPQDAFHAKGYLFAHQQAGYQSAIIGSANLTQGALLQNYEWNIEFTSHENGALTGKLMAEVEAMWAASQPLTDLWIDEYREEYDAGPKLISLTDADQAESVSQKIEPNQMQREALRGLADIRARGAHRGLIISATGTGKTYLGAFDVRSYQPKRFLYIVHREQILKKTQKSFKTILRHDFFEKSPEATAEEFDDQFGCLSGNERNYTAKYLFATIQTLSQPDQLRHFCSDEFDYILIDEAHRAGAGSYQRVLAHFQPKFLLGMTATPERMDDFNLYELFDYHVPYEIRLQKALDEDMLCPFNYIGVADYEKDGRVIDETSQLEWLTSDERVTYVIQQTQYYGYSGEVLRGLIFCSRTDEAEELAQAFTMRGYPSAALTGSTPQKTRENLVEQLEQGDLCYIITVDVFNEGVDIPCVNQIVMLRNTQSSIVFIQQLGRGLRKFAGKDYVTVIDFIGNYKNNYLIPIALTGDKSRNKNVAHDDLDVQQISGVSTISFSKIAKERIYESINTANLDGLRVLREDYQALKNQLGRIPLLTDFEQSGTVDCMVFAKKFSNYYQFLLRMKEDVHLTLSQEQVLNFVSIELMNGKRVVELRLLRQLLAHGGTYDQASFSDELQADHVYYNATVERSVERVLSLAFFVPKSQEKYGDQAIVTLTAGRYQLSQAVQTQLAANPLFQQLVVDAINAGLERSKPYRVDQQFTLYQRYTRKDVCRLLGWQSDVSSTLYGYRVRDGICPIFVTYAKSDDIDDSIKYADKFLNPDLFLWYTRHNNKLDSKEVRQILQEQTTIHLFVKKSDDEGSDFYYFGEVTVQEARQETFTAKGKKEPIVRMLLALKQSVQFDKYIEFEK